MNLVVRSPATIADVVAELIDGGAVAVSTAGEEAGDEPQVIRTVVYFDGDTTTTLTPGLLIHPERDALLARHTSEMKRIGKLLEGAAVRGARAVAIGAVALGAFMTASDLATHHSLDHVLATGAGSAGLGALCTWLIRQMMRRFLLGQIRAAVVQHRKAEKR